MPLIIDAERLKRAKSSLLTPTKFAVMMPLNMQPMENPGKNGVRKWAWEVA
jgi:hypothetical protein